MPQPKPKVLVLRLAERLDETLTACRTLGVEPLAQSYGTIVSRETTLPANITGILVSSSSALDSLPKTTLPLYCVGAKTAKRAAAKGFRVANIAAETAAQLATVLVATLPPQKFLHACGDEAETDAFERLTAHGFTLLRQTSYQIEKSEGLDPLVLWHLQQNQVTLGMVFSYQSGVLLRRLLAENGLEAPFPVVVISPKAAKAFTDWPQVTVAATPTLVAMLDAVREQLQKETRDGQPSEKNHHP